MGTSMSSINTFMKPGSFGKPIPYMDNNCPLKTFSGNTSVIKREKPSSSFIVDLTQLEVLDSS